MEHSMGLDVVKEGVDRSCSIDPPISMFLDID